MHRFSPLLVLLLACGPTADDDASPTPTPGPCSQQMIVTDIDETLTTSNGEFLAQLLDPGHDPEMRPEANLMMRDYRELGFGVGYVTARGEDITLLDGRSATQASQDWLDGHGFPAGPLFLGTGIGLSGQAAADYKTQVLADLTAEGWSFSFAYGNADTDIEAYKNAGLPFEDIFLVGDLAGTLDVTGITNEDAYAQHRADFLPTLASPCP